jgi:YHS domain-containing protein
MNNRRILFALAAWMLLLFVPLVTLAAIEPVHSNSLGAAIGGYDPVAYFSENAAVLGSAEYSYDWNGTQWHFSSPQNLDLFTAEPEKYAPQYGGYCAWAASRGYTAGTDPEAWSLYDGKLYLNYSKGIRNRWSKDIPGNVEKADKNWPDLLDPR